VLLSLPWTINAAFHLHWHDYHCLQARGLKPPQNGGGAIINMASVQGLQSQRAVPA